MTRGKRIGGKFAPRAGYTMSVGLYERLDRTVGVHSPVYQVLDAMFDRLSRAIGFLEEP